MAVEPGLVLVSGPSRSGKSRWAESLLQHHGEVTYVATSARRADDAAWQRRIQLHQARRPDDWLVLESDRNLAAVIQSVPEERALLIDALGGYVAWCLEMNDTEWQHNSTGLIDVLRQRTQPAVLVIEETGWGVVPATAVGGLFRDRLGSLAQALEQHSQRSWLVIQGRALDLHALGVPV